MAVNLGIGDVDTGPHDGNGPATCLEYGPEVVGMSGGNKYFFPGVAGQRIIDVSHWLGALITSAEIIGTTGLTPVRALIDEGAALIPAAKYAFCGVTAEAASSPDGDYD